MLNLTHVSKVLSHALRHEPWLYELELDQEGWTNVADVLAALRKESPDWAELSADDLARMIAASEKQRHELCGDRIRALYGHSLPGKLARTPAAPPAALLHGTSPAAWPAIRTSGLLPMGRQYVHLSSELATAAAVGKRKAHTPIILRIHSADAHARGVRFYIGNEKVWLADAVPAEFIELLE